MDNPSGLTKNAAILKTDSSELEDARLHRTETHAIEIENKSDNQEKRADDANPKILPDSKSPWVLRVGSAAFYGIASIMITVINKRILTVYEFPSFQVLSIGQMTSTILIF